MPLLSVESTADKILQSYEEDEKEKTSNRSAVGASEIGNPCKRATFFSFRRSFPTAWSGRMLKLFSRGDIEESLIVGRLQRIGLKVHSSQSSKFTLSGWFGGHIDGIVEGVLEAPATPHLLEVKTCNTFSFKKLVKEGVKAVMPTHYAQMQTYMALFKLDRALYLSTDKNDETLYQERVYRQKNAYLPILATAEEIITAEKVPPKIEDKKHCTYCRFKTSCFSNAQMQKGCRTCKYVIFELDKNKNKVIEGSEVDNYRNMTCARYKIKIDSELEREGCDAWQQIEYEA